MRHPVRLCVLAVCGAVLVSGCALRDPRDSYAYGRVADGLWDADYDLLLDWNFPTSANQGPLEVPKRFRPERTAIGVPWATGNPMLPKPEPGAQSQALEPPASTSSAHEGDGDDDDETQAAAPARVADDPRADARVRAVPARSGG